MTSVLSKIHLLLTPAERKSALAVLGLMAIGMMLETIGVGLVIPVIALLMQDDLVARYPAFAFALNQLGNPSQQALFVGAMLGLVVIYLAKNLFLAFLAWKQTRFAFGVQAQISQRLFTTYLRQPYTFHLQRNTANLIRNVTGEMRVFTYNILIPAMTLLTEGLVRSASHLLLVVEPLGTLIVVLVIGRCLGLSSQHACPYRSLGGAPTSRGLRLCSTCTGFRWCQGCEAAWPRGRFSGAIPRAQHQSARVGQLQSTLQQLPAYGWNYSLWRAWLPWYWLCCPKVATW